MAFGTSLRKKFNRNIAFQTLKGLPLKVDSSNLNLYFKLNIIMHFERNGLKNWQYQKYYMTNLNPYDFTQHLFAWLARTKESQIGTRRHFIPLPFFMFERHICLLIIYTRTHMYTQQLNTTISEMILSITQQEICVRQYEI